MINTYRILLGEPEGKRPLETSRSGWEIDIKNEIRL
jgi:hypothetical protein